METSGGSNNGRYPDLFGITFSFLLGNTSFIFLSLTLSITKS